MSTSKPRHLWIGLALGLLASACHNEHQQYVKDLKADRPEIRAAAIHGLGAMGDTQDLGAIITKAQDSSGTVRKAVAEALSHLGQMPRAVDALSTLLGDPDVDVQSQAAQSLAAIGTEKARAYLTSSFARRGSATRAVIASALGMGPLVAEAVRKEADAIRDRNLKALEDGEAAEKVAAAEELGRSGRTEAVERLLPLLGNDSILLAAGAARGLGWAGDPKAVPPLMAVLKQNDPPLREASAQALGELGEAQALTVLGPLAASSDAASADAAAALTKLLASAEVNAALCAAASASSDPTAVAVSARAMAGRGGCPLPPVLARLGKSAGESRLGLLALEKLGVGQEQAGAKVAPLLEDKDLGVRLAAASTLGALGGKAATAALSAFVHAGLEKLKRQREKWVKEPLPKVFGKGIQPPQVMPGSAEFGTKLNDLQGRVRASDEARAASSGKVLHEVKSAPTPEVIPDTDPAEIKLLAVAVAALGRARTPEAAAMLEPVLSDADDDLRSGALVGLAYVGDGEQLKKVQQAWGDLPPEAVPQVAEALSSRGTLGTPVLLGGLTARDTERAPLAEALGMLKPPEAEAPLEKLLDAGGIESAAAATALAKLGNPASVQRLVDLLRAGQEAAPLEMVQALGSFKDQRAREALTGQLFNERTEVRAAAVRAISALGVGTSATALEALRGDYYREVRRAVEQALGAAPSGH